MKFSEFREEDRAYLLGAVLGGLIGLVTAFCLVALIEKLF